MSEIQDWSLHLRIATDEAVRQIAMLTEQNKRLRMALEVFMTAAEIDDIVAKSAGVEAVRAEALR